MHIHNYRRPAALVVACGLVWLLAACSRQPSGVEVVLADDQPGTLAFPAVLSPARDQFVYTYDPGVPDSKVTAFVMNLTTGERREIPLECRDSLWLDNNTLFCWPAISVLDVTTFESQPAQQQDAKGQLASSFVRPDHQIYQWSRTISPYPHVLLRAPDPSNTLYLFNVDEDDPIWQRADVIPFSSGIMTPVFDTPVPSPDGQYYYTFHFTNGDENALRLYTAADDQLVREVRLKSKTESGATVTGWTYDSSGVIYRVSNSFLSLPRPAPILKLTVPQ